MRKKNTIPKSACEVILWAPVVGTADSSSAEMQATPSTLCSPPSSAPSSRRSTQTAQSVNSPSASPKVRAWTSNKCDVDLLLRWTFRPWVARLKISTALVDIAWHNHNALNKTMGWWRRPGAIVRPPLASQRASLSFMLNETLWGGKKEEFPRRVGSPWLKRKRQS